ncbi:uncharacterized protein LOC116349389 [Contarinia nasturtii]|uniref:uncharacterized protein LOC116349389 n=1 Tax=Contarinia nasturtii TaxID=265458 RepID=UPI0012D45190|nr:uncharacterized protein LOC116349389 [Contarinia nasturtii]
MFKVIAFVFMVIACVCAAPKPDVLTYSAPVVAAPLVTSSAVVSREFHGNTAEYVAAAYPYVSTYSSPYIAAAPYSAYTSTVLL